MLLIEVDFMKKRVLPKIIAALAIAATTLVSCGSSEVVIHSGYKEISSEDVSYDLFVPETWIVDRQDSYTAAHRSGMDASNISVMAYELPSDKNFTAYEDYWKTYEPTLKAVFTDLEYISENEKRTVSNIEAAEYVYTATMNHGLDSDGTESIVPYKIQQILVKKEGTIYILTYTAQQAAYDDAFEEVNNIWDYFCFH